MGYGHRSTGSGYGQFRKGFGRSPASIQASRSKRSKSLDALHTAKIARNEQQWINNPGRTDLPGIDTAPIKPEEAKKEPSTVFGNDAVAFWGSLGPMERYRIMKEVEKGGSPGRKHSMSEYFNYIVQNNLMGKKAEAVTIKPQVVETKTEQVLVQPVIVKTGSIPEVKAEPSPNKAKTYATGGQSFEVLEGEYIDHYIAKLKNRHESNIRYFEDMKRKTQDDPRMTERKKKNDIEKIKMSMLWDQKTLERLEKPESRASYEHSAKEEYIKFIKESIKHGKPVPEEVVKQRPEFQVAQDARRRYEKGLHTSFANKSAAVNAVMFLEKGYKVKRQDGQSIVDSQISEIGQGIEDIQKAFGSTKDVMEKADLTIAHTSGKYPFLMKAGGLYHPVDKTITMGIAGIKSLAHEWAHWLDYEGGVASKYGYEFYTNGRTSKKINSLRTALSKAEEGHGSLCTDAAYHLNNPSELRDIWKKAYGKSKQVSKEERKDAQEVAARVGGYWRDPREVWARLVEQYVAVDQGRRSEAAESPEYYYKHPAYWSKEQFAEYKPIIKAEIEKRLSNARGN